MATERRQDCRCCPRTGQVLAEMQFLVRTEFCRPETLDEFQLDQIRQAERLQAISLQESGTIRHLWRELGSSIAWGVWEAPNENALMSAIDTLPAREWMSITVFEVVDHPNSLNHESSPRRSS